MEKTYVITWKSKLGAFTKQGTKLFTRDEAEALAVELNDEHPEIFHEILNLHPAEPSAEVVTVAAKAKPSDDNVIIRDVDFAAATDALPAQEVALA